MKNQPTPLDWIDAIIKNLFCRKYYPKQKPQQPTKLRISHTQGERFAGGKEAHDAFVSLRVEIKDKFYPAVSRSF